MPHLIRIAVKLLLIVSVAMQPTFAVALSAECSHGCMAQLTCQGCGHCSVEKPEDLCTCCSGPHEERVAEGEAVWCEHDSADEHGDSLNSVEAPCAGLQDGADPVADESQCCQVEVAIESSADKTVVVSTCHCVQAPETPYAPVPRTTAHEVRVLVVHELACDSIVGARNQLGGLLAFENFPAVAMPHFAQIAFCVWRL